MVNRPVEGSGISRVHGVNKIDTTETFRKSFTTETLQRHYRDLRCLFVVKTKVVGTIGPSSPMPLAVRR